MSRRSKLSTPTTSAPVDGQRCLTVPQAAAQLAISRAKLYQLLSNGSIESLTIGRSRRIRVAALDDYIARRVADTM